MRAPSADNALARTGWMMLAVSTPDVAQVGKSELFAWASPNDPRLAARLEKQADPNALGSRPGGACVPEPEGNDSQRVELFMSRLAHRF